MRHLKALSLEEFVFLAVLAVLTAWVTIDVGHYHPESVVQLGDLRAGW